MGFATRFKIIFPIQRHWVYSNRCRCVFLHRNKYEYINFEYFLQLRAMHTSILGYIYVILL